MKQTRDRAPIGAPALDDSTVTSQQKDGRIPIKNQSVSATVNIPRRALEVGLLHFLIVLLIQIQNTWLSEGVAWHQTVFAQFENFTVSAALGAVYIFFRGNRLTNAAFYVLYFSSLMIIALSQVYYRIFREQFAFFQIDEISIGNILGFWDSFTAEFGIGQTFNLSIIGIAALYFLTQATFDKCINAPFISLDLRRLAPLLVVPAIIFGYFQFGRTVDPQAQKINSHLFVAAWSGFGKIAVASKPEVHIDTAKIYQLKYGSPYSDPTEDRLLQENLQILQQRKKNVIFIILESVGSKQILQNGLPQEGVTPFLYRQKNNSIIFSNLHNTFPASTRSHIALATGGATVTWGSVYDQLAYPYIGQTVVSAMAQEDRSTALFSAADLNYENLYEFYRNLKYDLIFDPAFEAKEFQAQHAVHSWGIDEKAVIDKAVPWMKNAKKPFFLNFLTINTHHPYGVPKGFASPFHGTDNLSKYKSALHYTDNVIEYLVKNLEANNLDKDTLLFIVGDHGEAFGDLHKNNFVHRNYLYEENIRNFLMIVDLEKRLKPVSSSRRGTVADVMPTILATQDISSENYVIGRNLLSGNYAEKIAYFHKFTEPEQWGLRDGEWKFIIEKDGERHPEFYNLNADPDELINLADKHSDRIDAYVNMISNWIVYVDSQFVKRLDGYEKNYDETSEVADLGSPGPKRIAIGRKPPGLPFLPFNGTVHPKEDLFVGTEGLAYPDDVLVDYVVTSPSGKRETTSFKHRRGWTKTYLRLAADRPREEGIWNVELLKEHKQVISTSFTVSKKAKLLWSYFDNTPGIRELFFGFMPESGDFEVLKRINPMEKVAVLSRGIPFGVDKTIYYTWVSPSGSASTKKFEVKSKWRSAWVFLNQEAPMEEGLWRVILSHKGKFLIAGSFEVSKDAPLNMPVRLVVRNQDKSGQL